MGENPSDLGVGHDFLVTTLKAQSKKERKKQINWISLKLKIYSIFFKKQKQLYSLKIYLVIGIACKSTKSQSPQKPVLMLTASFLLLINANSYALKALIVNSGYPLQRKLFFHSLLFLVLKRLRFCCLAL